MVANHLPQCRVDGFAVHAVIGNGAVHGPDDIGANHHRVDGRAVHPTGYVPVDPASSHHRTMQWCGVDGAIHVPVDPVSNHHRTMQWCGVDGAVHVPVDPASDHHRTMLSP